MAKAKEAAGSVGNRLLAVLPEGEFKKIEGSLEAISLKPDQLLWETDEKGRFIYFPTTSLISLLYESDDGGSVSIATLGRNGMVGTNLVLGDVRTPDRAVVLCGGNAFRMKARSAEEELANCGEFQSMMIAYAQVFITEVSQNAVCNRLHRIEQQLARWLLECHDELQRNIISMTQEQIAASLGVRRESISLAAAQLQNRGLIEVKRGKIKIRDLKSLEATSCECYSVIKRQLDLCLEKYRAQHSK